jgi:hypothetical protein
MKNIDITKTLDTITGINPSKILETKEIFEVIQIIDPIKIVDITEKGFDYGLWISVLVAIISTSILLWDKMKNSKVYGKTISKTYSQNGTFNYKSSNNEDKTLSGQQYILKLSLSCIRKSLNYKDVNVYLTYGNETVKGEIYWAEYSNLNFLNDNGTTTLKKMRTPANDFLPFNNILEKGKTSFYYLIFIVPNKSGTILYEKMELEFIKPNNKKRKFEISEINAQQKFFDGNLLEN